MKTQIINLVGASGSGKTTIAKELDKLDNINVIQSYTTRPPRSENEWGHTFIEGYEVITDTASHHDFRYDGETLYLAAIIDKSDNEVYFSDNMIAYFNSYKSGNHYFATDDQVIRGKTNIYVVDPNGAKQVHEYYKDTDIEVITIYLQADEVFRRNRLLARKRINEYQTDRNILSTDAYKENVIDRLQEDKEIFKLIKCNYLVDCNREKEESVETIKEIIGE